MKHELEGIFVIQYMKWDNTEYKPYVDSSGLPTLNIDNAKWYETRSLAYKDMLKMGLDKKCNIVRLD